MKLIIDIPEEGFNACKLWVEMGTATWQDTFIAKGVPYEERPQDDLIHSLTELCNRYCKNCLVIGEIPNPNDCTDCICTHIRGIMNLEKGFEE